jgi:hypothetical protein
MMFVNNFYGNIIYFFININNIQNIKFNYLQLNKYYLIIHYANNIIVTLCNFVTKFYLLQFFI